MIWDQDIGIPWGGSFHLEGCMICALFKGVAELMDDIIMSEPISAVLKVS